MHVIALEKMSLMPFSLDPNIFSVARCVYKQLYQPGFADNSCSFLNLFFQLHLHRNINKVVGTKCSLL